MTRLSTTGFTAALMGGVALVALTSFVPQTGWADTAANTLIQNQATASYTDENGNAYTSQSNLSAITVRQVYSASLSQDRSVTASAGQTVYFSHKLTNTGNGEDSYTLTLAQNNTTDTNNALDFENLQVYVDTNGNGQQDAGENIATTLTIASGESVDLVIAGKIPGGAADNTVFGATLSAASTTTGAPAVIDLTTNKGLDTLDGTNEVTATVTGDAVLNVSKQSTHDVANRQITYTVTVTNTGRIAARDVVLFDGLPANTTLVGTPTFNGFGAAIDPNDRNLVSADLDETTITPAVDLNGDGDSTDTGEAALDLDLDGDGLKTGTSLPGVYGFDDVLPPNTTVDMTFTVSYVSTLPSGTVFNNTAHVSGDVDGVAGPDGVVTSNQVTDVATQTYSVEIVDTGDGTGPNAATPGVNDGADDDDTADDIQTVDTAPSGALVLFDNVVTNNGNGTDTFEITFSGSTYPPFTVFSAWNASGTTQLIDTNNDGTVDTGPMASGEVRNIQVRVQLPSSSVSGDNGGNGYVVTTTTTSASDPTPIGLGGPANDTKTEKLEEISAPGVDLSNSGADDLPGTNQDELTTAGSPAEYVAITTEEGIPGDTVEFPLTIENDSGSSDSFQLFAGGSWNGTAIGALPAGWQVVFRDASNNAITTTPAIQPGSEITLTAFVTIPSDMNQSLANQAANIDMDAALDIIDGNGDGDGDYAIFFRTVSVNSGATDIKLDAVDVNPIENVTILPNNSGQVQPGGSVDYPHTLRNDGNTVEEFTLTGTNTLSGSSWGNAILVDTTGNGLPDTAFAALTSGTTTVFYTNAAGAYVSQVFDGNLELKPGENLEIQARVLAPSSAPNGQLDTLSVTATYNGVSSSVTAIDQTRVVLGQLRLVKTASVDEDCAGIATPDLGPDAAVDFEKNANSADPEDCVVWQVVATNEGTANVSTVRIADTVPAFTTYRGGTLRLCNGDAGVDADAPACTFSILTDPLGAPDDEGNVASDDIIFTLGAGTGTPVVNGGVLLPGQSVTVRFSTEVE